MFIFIIKTLKLKKFLLILYCDENKSRQDGWKKIFRMLFGTSLKINFKILDYDFFRMSRTSTHVSVQHVSSTQGSLLFVSLWNWRIREAERELPLCGSDVLNWRMCGSERYPFYRFSFPLWWIHKTITDATIEMETEIIEIIKKREISGSCSVSGVLFIKCSKYKLKNSKFESHQILFI